MSDYKKRNEKPKKVFVSGCFDLLHSGHITFLENAAKYGEVYVSVGSDKTIGELKNKQSVYSEDERVYMINAIKYVKNAFISNGKGILDFEEDLKKIRPDFFVVNEDGDRDEKKELCKSLGIEYIVLERNSFKNLPSRSSSEIRNNLKMPYRIDLAGGWLDQPYVSKFCSGQVLTISIEPSHNFNLRSGMASSTRNKAIEIWGNNVPPANEKCAKLLFGFENPPGTKEIAGSQDAIGIIMPGLNALYYEKGEYWPGKIESYLDENLLKWIESILYLIELGPRKGDYKVLDELRISEDGAKMLSIASTKCLEAILAKDIDCFGRYFKESFEAQIAMFPKMVDENILAELEKYKNQAKGWKISGAGGGGYMIFVSDKPLEKGIKIKIRRK